MGVITIANRLNEISSSSDLGSLTNFVASTEPTGDNNSAIYITKKVTLGQAATALQILFDAAVTDTAQMKVMYKILRTDSAENFQDIGWTYFNTSGIPDTTVPISKSLDDFKEYRFSAFWNFASSAFFKSSSSVLASSNDHADFCGFYYRYVIWIQISIFYTCLLSY